LNRRLERNYRQDLRISCPSSFTYLLGEYPRGPNELRPNTLDPRASDRLGAIQREIDARQFGNSQTFFSRQQIFSVAIS
jgi:hypothetical protein